MKLYNILMLLAFTISQLFNPKKRFAYVEAWKRRIDYKKMTTQLLKVKIFSSQSILTLISVTLVHDERSIQTMMALHENMRSSYDHLFFAWDSQNSIRSDNQNFHNLEFP